MILLSWVWADKLRGVEDLLSQVCRIKTIPPSLFFSFWSGRYFWSSLQYRMKSNPPLHFFSRLVFRRRICNINEKPVFPLFQFWTKQIFFLGLVLFYIATHDNTPFLSGFHIILYVWCLCMKTGKPEPTCQDKCHTLCKNLIIETLSVMMDSLNSSGCTSCGSGPLVLHLKGWG